MWDDGVATDATTPSRPITVGHVGQGQAGTRATCARPVQGTLRCDFCVSVAWETLKAADPAWYDRQHRLYRRQTAGGDA